MVEGQKPLFRINKNKKMVTALEVGKFASFYVVPIHAIVAQELASPKDRVVDHLKVSSRAVRHTVVN